MIIIKLNLLILIVNLVKNNKIIALIKEVWKIHKPASNYQFIQVEDVFNRQ